MQVPVHATSSAHACGTLDLPDIDGAEETVPASFFTKKNDYGGVVVDSHLDSALSEYQSRLGVEGRAPRHPLRPFFFFCGSGTL